MSLFDSIEATKDQSPIEPLGTEPTQPIGMVFSIDERERLKEAMRMHYGAGYKMANASDFFVTLLDQYIDENKSR